MFLEEVYIMSNLYYQDNNLCNITTILKFSFEENGHNYVKFEDDIFYPQGGGQKGDRGIIVCDNSEYRVVNTIKDKKQTGSLVLTDELVPEKCIGSEVDCILDWNFRYKQMKLHTCLHLYHCILEKVAERRIDYPITAAIEDGFAFNKYPEDAFDKSILEKVNMIFLDLLKSDTSVITYPDTEKEGYRWWECMDYKIPCGGIHVNNLKEINNVNIKVSSKKGFITIKLTL